MTRHIKTACMAAVLGLNMLSVPVSAQDAAADAETVLSGSALEYYAEAAADAFIYGDASGDGYLHADDAAVVLQKVLNNAYTMEIEKLTSDYLSVVDVSGDGKIEADDSMYIMQKVLNGTFKFPVEGGTGIIENTTEATTEVTTEVTTEATTEVTTEATTSSAGGETTTEEALPELDIVLADGKTSVSGADDTSAYISVDNTSNIITILSPSTYNMSGTLTDGQIVVNIGESFTNNNAEINLNGVDITNQSGPAIYGINGDIKLSAKKGTSNTLSDGTPAVFETETAEDGTVTTTDEPDGCIFSHDGISLKGKGELVINGNYANGISGKDEVEIKNLSLTVNAVKHAVKGKDYVLVESGTIGLTAQTGDGIHCSKGYVTISGGNVTINSYCDAVQAETELTVSGDAVINAVTTGTINTAADISAKGLKAGTLLTLDGGTVNISSTDDSIHTNGDMIVNAASITVSSGDDGLHADGTLTANEGCTVNVLKSYEGVEATYIYINGGTFTIYASDDNINAAGGNDTTSSSTERFGPNSGSTGYLEINGGYIYCENSNAMGDGIDSNGDLVINGGTVIVNGPTSDGDTAVDFGDGAQLYINGGTLIAVGSSGMAESPSSSGKAYALTYGVNGGMGGPGQGGFGMQRPGSQTTGSAAIAAGTLITLADANGNVAAALKVKVNTSAVIFGSDALTKGSTYTLYTGGTYSGTLDDNGFGTGGTISGGTAVASGTISTAVTALS